MRLIEAEVRISPTSQQLLLENEEQAKFGSISRMQDGDIFWIRGRQYKVVQRVWCADMMYNQDVVRLIVHVELKK